MGLWRSLSHGSRRLFRREQAAGEVSEEVRHFFDEAIADYQARGLSPEEARRRARLELGGMLQAAEEVHDFGWESWAEALLIDLRLAGRRLFAEKAFAFVLVMTVAIGIGATTAIFSAVKVVLLESLPLPEADRIVTIWDRGSDGDRQEQTFGTFLELEARSRGFEALAVMKAWQPTLAADGSGLGSGGDAPERVPGQRVSADYFRVLGVPVAMGRSFRVEEDREGGPAEVILADSLWRRRFGADPEIVGRGIELDDRTYAVIGVMPPGFENVPAPSAELWSTLQYDISQGRAWGHHLRTIGRMAPGVGLDGLRLELDQVAAHPVAEFPRPDWAALEHGLWVSALQEEVTAEIRPALLAIFGAAGLVLAIGVGNVVHLLFARGARRHGELALRTALGAGHGRLIRQLATENLVLVALGGAVGMAVAWLGVRGLVLLAPPELPRIHAIRIDGVVFAFGLVTTLLIGGVFGLIPASRAARRDPRAALASVSKRTVSGLDRTRGALVVAEVALAVVLLVGSGLLLRSLQQLMAVDAGFAADGLLTLELRISGERYDNAASEQLFARVLERVGAVPGVLDVAFTSQLPLGGGADIYGVFFEPSSAPPGERESGAFRYTVSPSYLETMGIALIRGRDLGPTSADDGAREVVISESLARRRLPGLDPIGRRLKVGPPANPAYEVVGVAADVRQQSLALDSAEAFYLASTQWHFVDRTRRLVVRADPALAENWDAMVPAIRQAIWTVDDALPITRVAAMGELLTASVAQRRFASTLFQAFALASLLLSAAGIYGVLAGRVAERTREMGVRSALGAEPEQILALVARQGLRLTGMGFVLGGLVAMAASEALSALIFGISKLDPLTYLGVVVVIATVSIVACAVPAWRAARVDPAIVLRAD